MMFSIETKCQKNNCSYYYLSVIRIFSLQNVIAKQSKIAPSSHFHWRGSRPTLVFSEDRGPAVTSSATAALVQIKSAKGLAQASPWEASVAFSAMLLTVVDIDTQQVSFYHYMISCPCPKILTKIFLIIRFIVCFKNILIKYIFSK